MRFEVAVCITHEPADDVPRPLRPSVPTTFDRDTRADAR